MYCVYKHTSPSGKVYFGITSKNPLDRWQNGHGYKSNPHFWNAIVKYGWDNFQHEILFSELTKEEACQKEADLISEYQSNNFEFGYNRSSGGEMPNKGCKKTDEQRRKTSQTLMNHSVSEATKEKIRAARQKQTYFGVHPKRMGSDNPKSRQVAQCDESGNIIAIFETVSQAASAVHACHQSISDCCRGKIKTVKGFIFQYSQRR